MQKYGSVSIAVVLLLSKHFHDGKVLLFDVVM